MVIAAWYSHSTVVLARWIIMKRTQPFDTDNRGVSPVIGVILMVAITVILAAVIGTFVLGLGDSLGDSQPTAQLTAGVDYGNTGGAIFVEHDGGDSIETDSLNVIVNSPDVGNSAEGTIGQRLGVGDAVTASLSGGGEVSAGQELRIRVVHQPSESILLDRTFEADQETNLSDGSKLTF